MFPLSAGVTGDDTAIEIRILEEHHAIELFRLVEANRPGLRQWLPWLDWSTSPGDTADHIRHSLERYRESNGFSAGIWVGRELGGAIGLHAIDPRHRSSSIGYWLSQNFRGSGIATESVRAIVNAGFEQYNLHRIEIRCATGNDKSCAIARRLGFTHEGILREAEWLYDHFVDLAVYAMLEQDWPTRSTHLSKETPR